MSVGRLTTLTEARKEKNSYSRLFQLSLEKEMLKEGMWFESRTVVPEPFVSFSHSSLQINPRWLWGRDMGNENFSNFFITPVI